MLIHFYISLIILSLVFSAVYVILKLLEHFLGERLSVRWYYRTGLAVFLSLAVPYYKLFSLTNLDLFLNDRGEAFLPKGLSTVVSQAAVLNSADFSNSPLLPWLNLLCSILMTGTAAFLCFVFIQNRRLHRRITNNCQINQDPSITNLMNRCKQNLGLFEEISLWVAPHPITPFLIGIRKPRIVLPNLAFTEEDLVCIFTHELTHWKRRDPEVKLLVLLIQAVYWFHPLVYLFRRDMERFCELSCDQQLSFFMSMDARNHYCKLLLRTLKDTTNFKPKLYAAFSDKRQWSQRIKVITSASSRKSGMAKRFLSLLLTCLILSSSAAAVYALTSRSDLPEISATTGEIVARRMGVSSGSYQGTELQAYYSLISVNGKKVVFEVTNNGSTDIRIFINNHSKTLNPGESSRLTTSVGRFNHTYKFDIIPGPYGGDINISYKIWQGDLTPHE